MSVLPRGTMAAPYARERSQSVSSDGARAILDQLPTTTPKARAVANQTNVDPPKKIKASKGIRVVPEVYSVRVRVADTA